MKLVVIKDHTQMVQTKAGVPIGYALLLGGGGWAPFDLHQHRLVEIGVKFATPKNVLTFFKLTHVEKDGGE